MNLIQRIGVFVYTVCKEPTIFVALNQQNQRMCIVYSDAPFSVDAVLSMEALIQGDPVDIGNQVYDVLKRAMQHVKESHAGSGGDGDD